MNATGSEVRERAVMQQRGPAAVPLSRHGLNQTGGKSSSVSRKGGERCSAPRNSAQDDAYPMLCAKKQR